MLTILGFFVFIVPAIVLGTRLFWADEFALVHRTTGTIEALKESRRLTQGKFRAILRFQLLLSFTQSFVVLLLASLLFGLLPVFESGQSRLLKVVRTSLALFFSFLTYGALHAPALVYFHGMRVARARPHRTKILDL